MYLFYAKMFGAGVGGGMGSVISFKLWNVKLGLLFQKNNSFWNTLLKFQIENKAYHVTANLKYT